MANSRTVAKRWEPLSEPEDTSSWAPKATTTQPATTQPLNNNLGVAQALMGPPTPTGWTAETPSVQSAGSQVPQVQTAQTPQATLPSLEEQIRQSWGDTGNWDNKGTNVAAELGTWMTNLGITDPSKLGAKAVQTARYTPQEIADAQWAAELGIGNALENPNEQITRYQLTYDGKDPFGYVGRLGKGDVQDYIGDPGKGGTSTSIGYSSAGKGGNFFDAGVMYNGEFYPLDTPGAIDALNSGMAKFAIAPNWESSSDAKTGRTILKGIGSMAAMIAAPYAAPAIGGALGVSNAVAQGALMGLGAKGISTPDMGLKDAAIGLIGGAAGGAFSDLAGAYLPTDNGFTPPTEAPFPPAPGGESFAVNYPDIGGDQLVGLDQGGPGVTDFDWANVPDQLPNELAKQLAQANGVPGGQLGGFDPLPIEPYGPGSNWGQDTLKSVGAPNDTGPSFTDAAKGTASAAGKYILDNPIKALTTAGVVKNLFTDGPEPPKFPGETDPGNGNGNGNGNGGDMGGTTNLGQYNKDLMTDSTSPKFNKEVADALYEASMRYVDPEIERQLGLLRSRLGEQGFTSGGMRPDGTMDPGAPAWGQEMQTFNRRADMMRNDARDKAIAQGAAVGDMNLDTRAAIARTIADQVNQKYGYDMGNYNASVAEKNNKMDQLLKLGLLFSGKSPGGTKANENNWWDPMWNWWQG